MARENDRMYARKLSDLLRAGLLTPVYHGESGVRTLRELGRGSFSTMQIPASSGELSKHGHRVNKGQQWAHRGGRLRVVHHLGIANKISPSGTQLDHD
jgi:hypothetical protein